MIPLITHSSTSRVCACAVVSVVVGCAGGPVLADAVVVVAGCVGGPATADAMVVAAGCAGGPAAADAVVIAVGRVAIAGAGAVAHGRLNLVLLSRCRR